VVAEPVLVLKVGQLELREECLDLLLDVDELAETQEDLLHDVGDLDRDHVLSVGLHARLLNFLSA
jgi:hypothetical protein